MRRKRCASCVARAVRPWRWLVTSGMRSSAAHSYTARPPFASSSSRWYVTPVRSCQASREHSGFGRQGRGHWLSESELRWRTAQYCCCSIISSMYSVGGQTLLRWYPAPRRCASLSPVGSHCTCRPSMCSTIAAARPLRNGDTHTQRGDLTLERGTGPQTR